VFYVLTVKHVLAQILNHKLERVEINGFEPVHALPLKHKTPKKKHNNKSRYRKRKRNRKG
jgi:hypothetical protein